MNRIRVGLVGLNFGEKIIERFLVSGAGSKYFELDGVCDLSLEKCRVVSKRFSVRAYDSLDEMLKERSLAAIILMTGPHGRASLIRRIIRAGKDVITTKPFEVDAVEAESVLQEARELGRYVFMNSPCAARSRDWEVISRWRSDHRLGRLLGGHFESWRKSIEQSDGTWYDDPELCFAAPILRLGIYAINDIVAQFGRPVGINVLESRLFTGRPTSDYARVQMQFANGELVGIVNGFVTQPVRIEDTMILYFENGAVYRNPPLWVSGHVSGMTYLCLTTSDCRDGMPAEVVRIRNDETGSAYQWDVFYTAIVTRRSPPGATSDSVIVDGVRLLESIRESAAESNRVIDSGGGFGLRAQ